MASGEHFDHIYAEIQQPVIIQSQPAVPDPFILTSSLLTDSEHSYCSPEPRKSDSNNGSPVKVFTSNASGAGDTVQESSPLPDKTLPELPVNQGESQSNLGTMEDAEKNEGAVAAEQGESGKQGGYDADEDLLNLSSDSSMSESGSDSSLEELLLDDRGFFTTEKADKVNIKEKENSDNIDDESCDNIDRESCDNIDKENSDNIEKKDSGSIDKEDSDSIEKEDSDSIDKETSDNIDQETSGSIDKENSGSLDGESRDKPETVDGQKAGTLTNERDIQTEKDDEAENTSDSDEPESSVGKWLTALSGDKEVKDMDTSVTCNQSGLEEMDTSVGDQSTLNESQVNQSTQDYGSETEEEDENTEPAGKVLPATPGRKRGRKPKKRGRKKKYPMYEMGDDYVDFGMSASDFMPPKAELTPTEQALFVAPFAEGWRREVVIRGVYNDIGSGGKKKNPPADVYYHPPAGTGSKIRSMVQISDWLKQRNTSLTIQNFTFMRKPVHEPPGETIRSASLQRGRAQAKSRQPEVVIERDSDDAYTPVIRGLIQSPVVSKAEPVGTHSPIFAKRGRPPKRRAEDSPSKVEAKTEPKVETVLPSNQYVVISPPKKKVKATARKSTTMKTFRPKREVDYTIMENLCTLHCPGLSGVQPMLHCELCMCLFHPECVNFDTSSKSRFVCLRCTVPTTTTSKSNGVLISDAPSASSLVNQLMTVPQATTLNMSSMKPSEVMITVSLTNGTSTAAASSSPSMGVKSVNSTGGARPVQSEPSVLFPMSFDGAVTVKQEPPDTGDYGQVKQTQNSMKVAQASLEALGHLKSVLDKRNSNSGSGSGTHSSPHPAYPLYSASSTPPFITSQTQSSQLKFGILNKAPAPTQATTSQTKPTMLFRTFSPVTNGSVPAAAFPIASGNIYGALANQMTSILPPKGTVKLVPVGVPIQGTFPFEQIQLPPTSVSKPGAVVISSGSMSLPHKSPAVAASPVQAGNMGNLPGTVLNKGNLPGTVLNTGNLPGTVLNTGNLPGTVLNTGNLPGTVLNTGNLPVTVLNTGHIPGPVLNSACTTPTSSIGPVTSPTVVFPVNPTRSGQMLTLPQAVAKRLCLNKPVALKINNMQITVPPSGFLHSADGLKVILPSQTFPSTGADSVCVSVTNASESVQVSATSTSVTAGSANKAAVTVTSQSESTPVSHPKPSVQKQSDQNKSVVSAILKQPTVIEETQKAPLRRSSRYKKTCFVQKLYGGFDSMHHIFQYLNIRDLLSVCQVCRSWRRIAQHPSLWRDVSFHSMKIPNWCTVMQYLAKRKVEGISLYGLQHYDDANRTWHQLVSALKDMPTIKRIYFGVVPASVLHAICERLVQLEVFCAECISDFTNEQMWTVPTKLDIGKFASLGSLQELRLRGVCSLALPSFSFCGGLAELPILSNLLVLSLTSLKNVPDSEFRFLSQLTQLRELALGDCTTWTAETYFKLGQLTSLRRLRLEHGGTLPDIGLADAIKNLSNLERLELYSYTVADTLEPVLQKMARLRTLIIWPDNASQPSVVNSNTLAAVKPLVWLDRLDWVIPSSSGASVILDTNDNPERKESNSSRLQWIPFLGDSKSPDDYLTVGEKQTEYITVHELTEKLVKFLPRTRIKVYCLR